MHLRERLACFHSHLNGQQMEAILQRSESAPGELQDYFLSPSKSRLHRLIEEDIAWLNCRQNHHIISFTDSHYPPLLKEISKAPCLLYAVGDISLLGAPAFAIVGSRKPTSAGMENAAIFAVELTHHGLCISSGLAYGIDAAAHRACLSNEGHTIAIIGTGIDTVYPRKHLSLAKEIAARGLIISIFPRRTPPLRQNFPRRNSIMSGMSLGVLVVEAGIRSGALITARLAAEQGREVFAVPGSIHSAVSKGCHKLIRDGALLVENSEDILKELGALYHGYKEKIPQRDDSPLPELSNNAQEILRSLKDYPMHPDQFIKETNLQIAHIKAALMELEILSLVRQKDGLYDKIK